MENISDIKKHAIDCYYFRINNLISLEYIYIPYLFRRKSSLLLSSHKLGRIQQQFGSRRPMEAHHRSHHKSEHVTTVTLYNWIEFTSVQSHQKFTLAGEHRFARGAPRVSIYKFRGWIRRNEGIAPCIFHSWQSIVSILPQEGRIDSEPRDRDEVGIHRRGGGPRDALCT